MKMEKTVTIGKNGNKYTVINCTDNTKESLNALFKKYVFSIPEEEANESFCKFKKIWNEQSATPT